MNFLLIGPPGSWKTTSACSGRHPTLLLDVDGKADDMMNLKPLVEDGRLDIWPMKDKLIHDRLRDRAEHPDRPPKDMPMGYLHVVDVLNDILDGTSEYDKYATYVLDSLTRLAMHMTKLLVYHRGQGKFGKKVEDDMNWPSWGSYKSNLEEVFDGLRYMEKDFICTVHLKTMTEIQTVMMGSQIVEQTVITGYKPLIDGQMRDALAGFFNECYYMETKSKDKVMFRTRGGTKYDARTSMFLDEFEEPSIEGVLKKGGAW